SNETYYYIESATSSAGPFTQIRSTGANVTSTSSTALAASTTYYFRVRAYNSAGYSGYSATASATTQAAAPTLPATPTGLTATAASSSHPTLRSADLSNETYYYIESATSSAG